MDSDFNWRDQWKAVLWIVAGFLALYFLPAGDRLDRAVTESVQLARWYTREHVLLCLVTAFFIAGAISVLVRQESVIKLLGPQAKKYIAYPVAAVTGTILAVCSCTVLPLFAGIRQRGAGLGPAIAFLYSGPAINLLAIILTARILGMELGVARAIFAVVFSVVIGLAMAALFRERPDSGAAPLVVGEGRDDPPVLHTLVHLLALIAILVFANWSEGGDTGGIWHLIFRIKWWLTGAAALVLGWGLVRWYGHKLWTVALLACSVIAMAILFPRHPEIAFAAATVGLSILLARSTGLSAAWFGASWGFARQMLPLLLIGVLVSGFLLGRPGHEGLVPSTWIAGAVGGNSLFANFFAAIAGAFMYFATLTEVPIVQGLVGSGMGRGPALALLLAGPALSLPSMIVIAGVIGVKRTVAYTALVVIFATLSGLAFGSF